MAPLKVLIFLLVGCAAAERSAIRTNAENAANPIRKVVTMLQMMQKKIIEEGKKAEELYDKFMCYCETGTEALEKSIADAEAKIPQLEAAIKEHGAMIEQLKVDVEQHKTDRTAAKEAIAAAKALREKEGSAFAAESAELKSNIEALGKAIEAITKGMGTVGGLRAPLTAGFLQTSTAAVLRKLSVSMEMSSVDRDMLASFLSSSSSSGYVPQSQEIVGILKQMKDEMEKDLADAIEAEATAKASFEALLAAKEKEIEALTKAIEEKLERIGNSGVELAEMKNDLEDTKEGLAEDKKFLADMDKMCEQKKKEWIEYKATQSEELIALADTIKILNDDDALELFKKTLPSASSLMQLKMSTQDLQKRALAALSAGRSSHHPDSRLDFLELALKGKKIGFEKVIKMIDDLVELLAKEQKEDDEKQTWCLTELDTADDTKKALEHDISDLEKAISDAEEGIATLTSEIEALEDAIKALDKQVAEATEQRKAEHAEFEKNLAANNAANDLLTFAINRLNKFYNPKLYKPPPKRELTEEERITVNMGGTLAPTAPPAGIAGTGIGLVAIKEHDASDVAPPPPPEANLAYKKSRESGTGVIAMINLLKADLEKEITESTAIEADAQADYESFMKDAAETRAMDAKEITDKEGSKAALEEELLSNKEALKGKQFELMETEKYIMELHLQCDWLLQHFDLRKEARANEVEALKKAKDVLSGADYSM